MVAHGVILTVKGIPSYKPNHRYANASLVRMVVFLIQNVTGTISNAEDLPACVRKVISPVVRIWVGSSNHPSACYDAPIYITIKWLALVLIFVHGLLHVLISYSKQIRTRIQDLYLCAKNISQRSLSPRRKHYIICLRKPITYQRKIISTMRMRNY